MLTALRHLVPAGIRRKNNIARLHLQMVIRQNVLHVLGLVMSTRKLLGIQSLSIADRSICHYYVILFIVLF